MWDDLIQANVEKVISGNCVESSKSQKEKEKQVQEAAKTMAGQNKEEETNNNSFYVAPLTMKKTYCMQLVLATQADFLAEKPFLQIEIE